MSMTFLRKILVAGFAAALFVAPLLVPMHQAEARAGWTSGGGYSSMGSMGSRTYNFNGGSPINRSMTPNSPTYSGAGGYGYGGYGGYGGGLGYHPFWGGLAGGLFGGWLGSMMFPHWGWGGGYGYGGGMGWGGGFLSIIFWLFIFWIGWRIVRRLFWHGGYGGFAGPGPGMGFMNSGPANFGPTPMYGGPGPAYGPVTTQIATTPADHTAFEAVLRAVQGSWSKADLATLRHYVTPEMLSYFSEQLSENNSAGVENHVEDVELIGGDVRDAWSEGNLEYATALMHWKARDWTEHTDRKRGDANWLANGDPDHQTEAKELWTFARSPGGHWLLSAIQQV